MSKSNKYKSWCITFKDARIKHICQLFELQKEKKVVSMKNQVPKTTIPIFSQGEIKQRKVNLNFVLEL